MPARECEAGESLRDGGTPQDTECSGLYETYHQQVRGYFAKRVRCPHDVDDLVQNVFTSLMAHRGRMLNPQVYVHFVVRHQLSAYWRKRRRPPTLQVLHDGREEYEGIVCRDADSDPVNYLSSREAARTVHSTISRLSPLLAEALRLRLLNGLALSEAATKAGCSLPTLKKRLQRARQSFMELYIENISETDRPSLPHSASNGMFRY